MSTATAEPIPQFALDDQGKPARVTLATAAYVRLLVEANVTDPQRWLPGMERGASALARVREIEADCIQQQGEFDWETLSESVQDEYDSLCVLLEELQDTGERHAWADVRQTL